MAEKEKTDEVVYSKRQIITEVANNLNLYTDSVAEVYAELEDVIINHLLEADTDKKVIVKMFEGIRFESRIIPEHYHTHPIEPYVFVPDKLKIWCKISSRFKRSMQMDYVASKQMLYDFLKKQKLSEKGKLKRNDD